jgi:hypothetical protein
MRRGWGRLGGFGPRAGEMDRGPDGPGRFYDGPGGPGGPPPLMRDGDREFEYPGRPYAFRAQPGGPGFPPPPMRRGWGRLGGFGPRAGEMDRGPDGRGRFQEGARARGWQGQPQDD